MTIFDNIRTAARKRAAYRRTRAELAALPDTLALEDLGFYPGDAKQIARNAVYGRA